MNKYYHLSLCDASWAIENGWKFVIEIALCFQLDSRYCNIPGLLMAGLMHPSNIDTIIPHSIDGVHEGYV